MPLDRETVIETLKDFSDNRSGSDIVAAGMMRALQINGSDIRFVLEFDSSRLEEMQALSTQIEDKLKSLEGCETVTIILTSHSDTPSASASSHPQPVRATPQTGSQNAPNATQKIDGVDHIIVVASGKGGVGKSTVSANLACALAARGRKVGLLDGDVYGPSQPRMLGVSGRPSSPDGKVILPMRNHGVTMMSIGLMTNEGQAVAWRGPMLIGALQQMMTQVQWGKLDILVIDLPPGTGDVQMTLAQKFQLDGALIVSTPQDVALIDARKGIDMFQQLNVPILGMIENMSTHICSNCGHEEHVFGHGGVAAEAEKLGVPLLGEIPLHLNIRTAADGGAPIVITHATSQEAQSFLHIADQLSEMNLA